MRPNDPTEHAEDPFPIEGEVPKERASSRPRRRRSSRRLSATKEPGEVPARTPTLKLGRVTPSPAASVILTEKDPGQGRGLLDALEATERRRAELARSVGALQDEIDRGRERERQAAESIATFEQERTEGERAFAELHEQLAGAQRSLQEALGKLEASALERERLEEELASVRDEDAKARRALLDEEERRVAILNLSREKAVEKSEKDRRRAITERDGALRDKASLERELAAERARLGSELAALERRVELQAAQLRGVAAERDEARAARDRSARDCATALERYQEASAELRDASLAQEEAVAQLEHVRRELAKARSEGATHEKIHDQLVLDARDAKRRAEELERLLAEARQEARMAAEAEQQGARLAEQLQTTLSRVQTELDGLRADKELLDERLSAADGELDEATERAFRFMKERDDSRSRVLELTAALELAREGRRSSPPAAVEPSRASAKPTRRPRGPSSAPPLVPVREEASATASSRREPVLVENLPFEIADEPLAIPAAPKPPTFGGGMTKPHPMRREGRYSVQGGHEEEVTHVRLPRRK